jgi:hypothetical protein
MPLSIPTQRGSAYRAYLNAYKIKVIFGPVPKNVMKSMSSNTQISSIHKILSIVFGKDFFKNSLLTLSNHLLVAKLIAYSEKMEAMLHLVS